MSIISDHVIDDKYVWQMMTFRFYNPGVVYMSLIFNLNAYLGAYINSLSYLNKIYTSMIPVSWICDVLCWKFFYDIGSEGEGPLMDSIIVITKHYYSS